MVYITLALPLLALATVLQGQDIKNATEIVIEDPVDEVNRNNVLVTLQQVIKNLSKDNDMLKEYLEKLKRECDENFKTWALIYKQLYDSIKQVIPEVKKLYKELANQLLRDRAITEALNKIKGYLEMLRLKKKIMNIDINELLKREREGDFDTCKKYGHYYNFEVGGELASRSLRARTSDTKMPGDVSDIARIMFGRKKAWLEMKREKQMYLNVEYKRYIEYYTLYCERRKNFVKVLIENLRGYEEMHLTVEELRKKVYELKNNVTNKVQELQPLQDEMYKLAPEILRLQKIYDKLKDQANCFLSLDRWHINDDIEKFKQMTNMTDNIDSIVAGEKILPTSFTPVDTNPLIPPNEHDDIEKFKQLTNMTDDEDSTVAGEKILPSSFSSVGYKPVIPPHEDEEIEKSDAPRPQIPPKRGPK